MAVSQDDNQPCSLNLVTAGEEDGCSLILELPDDDPLLEEKKKLILAKGFAVSERICFSNSLFADKMDAILDKLLQRARIIQLNEIELYFCEIAVDPPSEFYSPRNELEALNLVLSQIDISLKSCKHENSVLQHLRGCTIDRISGIGARNLHRTRVVDGSCEKVKGLLQWAEMNGVKSKLEISHVQGSGRGALAVQDLSVGDIALEIPVSAIISDDVVYDSDMFHILKQIDGISAETMLLLWSMRERHNSSSILKHYFETLPDEFNTGLSFSLEGLMVLEGTLVMEEIIKSKEHLQSQYDQLIPVLCENFPEIFPPELYTWEQYLWACELWYSNSMKIMFTDGYIRTCLIPIAGFLNHSICPHILHYGKVDPKTNSLKFPLSAPCKASEECFLSYGNLPSSHLLTFYGFLPQGENPYDFISLSLDSDNMDCSTEESVSHMVRGTWHSKNYEIFHYGLPSPLLNHIRKSHNSFVHTLTSLQENLENEMRVLEDLDVIFKEMLDRLEDSDNCREDMSWDVKLAVEFKGQQRRIISSVISSVKDGLVKVENALLKCMAEDTRG